ncbi:MAG: hypothetical protein AB3N33_10205 [Puniceicoccaceae bacterium]
MNNVVSQLKDWIKIITELGIGLVALGILAEVIFGQGALFGASVVNNLSEIVGSIGGDNGFVGLVAILLIFALIKGRS